MRMDHIGLPLHASQGGPNAECNLRARDYFELQIRISLACEADSLDPEIPIGGGQLACICADSTPDRVRIGRQDCEPHCAPIPETREPGTLRHSTGRVPFANTL